VSLIPDASHPTGKLPPDAWLSEPDTLAVVAALTAEGADVRFVGGCVRDSLARRPVGDIDIATPDRPDKVVELLTASAIRAVPTGIDHGTVSAVTDTRTFEITTLRRDVETDGRHATVAFTEDWVEDAKRRDFTINALSATPDGDVFDPFDGIGDLAHGHIRFVGLARERVEEDYLRILRFFRFYGSFGRPPIDTDALAACRAGAEGLKNLSGERIRGELFKILIVPEPADIVIRMRGEGVLEHVLPEAGEINTLRLVNWLETRATSLCSIAPDAVRHLASLLDGVEADIDTLAARLKLSNREKSRLSVLHAPQTAVSPDMGTLAEKKLLRHEGTELFRDLVLLGWAHEMAAEPRLPRERKESWLRMLEDADTWQPPAFPLTGRDVRALGIAEGPLIGELLTRVEVWWENGDYKAGRQACLDRLLAETEGSEP